MGISRRDFGKWAGAAAMAACTSHAPLFLKTPGDRLRVAAVGLRGRCKALISAIEATPSMELVALADVDAKVLAEAEKENTKLDRVGDFRKLLDRKDIDIVVSATPNHWHALVTVLSCQAGKHVYIEKPISHNMSEGLAIVRAAEKYNRIVQCGFQNRSDTGLTGFYSRLRKGDFGKVLSVHGLCHRPRKSIGKLDRPLQVPSWIDYDLWLGPAADQPIMRPQLHYDWHWDFNTGNGDVGNQGPHEWDMLNWALGDPDALPTRMVAAGNRFAWHDAGNTPNVMACAGESNGIPVFFEVMDLVPGGKPRNGIGVGVVLETSTGTFSGSRGGGKFTWKDGRIDSFSRDQTQSRQDGTVSHMGNFADAVIAGDRSQLHADCSVAARSSSMAHMANISYRLGSPASSRDIEDVFLATEIGRDMLSRLRDATRIHAAASGNMKIEPWILGASLAYDNSRQQFDNNPDANTAMSREYRAGFEIPSV